MESKESFKVNDDIKIVRLIHSNNTISYKIITKDSRHPLHNSDAYIEISSFEPNSNLRIGITQLNTFLEKDGNFSTRIGELTINHYPTSIEIIDRFKSLLDSKKVGIDNPIEILKQIRKFLIESDSNENILEAFNIIKPNLIEDYENLYDKYFSTIYYYLKSIEEEKGLLEYKLNKNKEQEEYLKLMKTKVF